MIILKIEQDCMDYWYVRLLVEKKLFWIFKIQHTINIMKGDEPRDIFWQYKGSGEFVNNQIQEHMEKHFEL